MRKAKNDEWLIEEMAKDAKWIQRRFWSKVRHNSRETDTQMRGLDVELRWTDALSRWREHFDNLFNGNAGWRQEFMLMLAVGFSTNNMTCPPWPYCTMLLLAPSVFTDASDLLMHCIASLIAK